MQRSRHQQRQHESVTPEYRGNMTAEALAMGARPGEELAAVKGDAGLAKPMQVRVACEACDCSWRCTARGSSIRFFNYP
jgi:hypothetical protein